MAWRGKAPFLPTHTSTSPSTSCWEIILFLFLLQAPPCHFHVFPFFFLIAQLLRTQDLTFWGCSPNLAHTSPPAFFSIVYYILCSWMPSFYWHWVIYQGKMFWQDSIGNWDKPVTSMRVLRWMFKASFWRLTGRLNAPKSHRVVHKWAHSLLRRKEE